MQNSRNPSTKQCVPKPAYRVPSGTHWHFVYGASVRHGFLPYKGRSHCGFSTAGPHAKQFVWIFA